MQHKTGSNRIFRIYPEEMQVSYYKKRLLTAVHVYEPVKKATIMGYTLEIVWTYVVVAHFQFSQAHQFAWWYEASTCHAHNLIC